jgi:hypothetical protein
MGFTLTLGPNGPMELNDSHSSFRHNFVEDFSPSRLVDNPKFSLSVADWTRSPRESLANKAREGS